MIPIPHLGKQTLREVKSFAQGHPTSNPPPTCLGMRDDVPGSQPRVSGGTCLWAVIQRGRMPLSHHSVLFCVVLKEYFQSVSVLNIML